MAMPQWSFVDWLSFFTLHSYQFWTPDLLYFSLTGISSNEQHFRDCAEAYKSGHNTSGVYHIYIGDMTEPTKVWDAFFHKYEESVWYILAVTYRTRNSANVRGWDWDVSYASDRSFVIWWQAEVAGRCSSAGPMEVWTSRKAGTNTNWWVCINIARLLKIAELEYSNHSSIRQRELVTFADNDKNPYWMCLKKTVRFVFLPVLGRRD